MRKYSKLVVQLLLGFSIVLIEIVSCGKSKTTSLNNTIVYITKSGEKYHRAGCACLSKSKIPLEDSKKEGYTPCTKCNPF